MQAVPLLESRDLIVSANDTNILLSCLELLETELLAQVVYDICSQVVETLISDLPIKIGLFYSRLTRAM